MKVLLITLLVAAVSAGPLPEESNGPVEMIVNGIAEGAPLEIGEILDVKLKEHTNDAVIATDLLHPFSAVGIAEAAAADTNIPDPVLVAEGEIPDPVILPEPAAPEVVDPEPIILPEPALPEVAVPPVILPELVEHEVAIPDPVVLPEPAAPEVDIPEPVILPEPVAPEVVDPVEELPSPASQDGEVYNDGVVSVSVNGPEDPSMLSALQSWFNMVVNYFSDDGAQTSQQIV